jgi:hypothetical protein
MSNLIRLKATSMFIGSTEGTISEGDYLRVNEARARELHQLGVVVYIDQPEQPELPFVGPATTGQQSSLRQGRALQPTMQNRVADITASQSTTLGESPTSPEPLMPATASGGTTTRKRSKRISPASAGPPTKAQPTD